MAPPGWHPELHALLKNVSSTCDEHWATLQGPLWLRKNCFLVLLIFVAWTEMPHCRFTMVWWGFDFSSWPCVTFGRPTGVTPLSAPVLRRTGPTLMMPSIFQGTKASHRRLFNLWATSHPFNLHRLCLRVTLPGGKPCSVATGKAFLIVAINPTVTTFSLKLIHATRLTVQYVTCSTYNTVPALNVLKFIEAGDLLWSAGWEVISKMHDFICPCRRAVCALH